MDTLRVGTALPAPPFNGMDGGGLDVDLVDAIGAELGLRVEVIAHDEPDVVDIFVALAAGAYDCVVAGITVTPERRRLAAFAPPYLISGQALAVDATRFPMVSSIDDLVASTVGVQHGNAGQRMAERLVAQGRAKAVRVYDDGDIGSAVRDLATGGCDAVMTLEPVLAELVRHVADVDVVQRGISREDIAVAVALGDDALLAQITTAQERLEADGRLQGMRRKWMGNPYRDQSLAAL